MGGDQPIFFVELSLEHVHQYANKIINLMQIISGWVSTTIIINGVEKYSSWEREQIGNILACYLKGKRSKKLSSYCTKQGELHSWDKVRGDGWGCRLLTQTLFDETIPIPTNFYFDKKSFWFQHGKLDGQVWNVNKEEIANYLEEESVEKELKLCTFFNFANIEKRINELPNQIDLKNNMEWVLYKGEQHGGRFLKDNKTIIPAHASRHRGTGFAYGGKGKSKRNIPKVSFDEIGGIDEILDRVRVAIEMPIKHPGILSYLGIKPHKGIILYGPPGCGKTLIAKAVANEVQAHFILINGPEILNKWWGESEKILRDLFSEAERNQPSVIFFDEIDSIGQKRSSSDNVRHYAVLVNQLLTLMDGSVDFGQTIVIAATNRLGLIDPALLRPGRFDYKLKIPLPDLNGCKKILEIATKETPISDDFSIESFANSLVGMSGADIMYIVKEAAYNCLERNFDIMSLIKDKHITEIKKPLVCAEDFYVALEEMKKESRLASYTKESTK